MTDIKKFWLVYQLAHVSNNMMVQKIRKEAFYAGAEMMRDHMNTVGAIVGQMDRASFRENGLTLVDSDTYDMFEDPDDPSNPNL